MMAYLLKSIVCLLVLLLVHRLLLQREAMHRFNRFFLLFSVVASFLIPLVTIEVPQKIAPLVEVISEPIYFDAEPLEFNQVPTFTEVAEPQFNWEYLLFGLYGFISLIFLYRFIRNIKILVNQIQRNIKINYRSQTLVLLKEDSLPFSFLKYIFVAESDLNNGKFTDAVFAHECAHIQERHSWDNLFIEALLVPLWFHPGLHWAKASIKLNHEFIADQVALRSTSLEKYESQLLAMMLAGQKYGLVSSLNFSLTKRRFEMMKRKSVNSKSWIKILALVPVLGALVYLFSERVTAKADSENAASVVYVNGSNSIREEVNFDLTFELKPNGMVQYEQKEYDLEGVKDLIRDRKSVKADLKINLITNPEMSMGELGDFQAVLRDLNIRKIYYAQGSKDGTHEQFEELGYSQFVQQGQKVTLNLQQGQLDKSEVAQPEEKEKYYRNASIFVEDESGNLNPKSYAELTDFEKTFLFAPLKSPAKSQPSTSDFDSWKNSDDFALWLDGKVIPNSQLENMSPSDVVYVFSSFVHLNARSKRFPQEHQVHLYSNEGYEMTYGAKSGFGVPLTKDDKLYIYPADKRVNAGKPWIKKVKDPAIDKQSNDPVAAYQEKNTEYEKLRNQSTHFVKRTKAEQDKLTAMFSDLGSMYYQIAFNDKPKVERPVHPFAPYLKLEANGEVYYKLKEDLTDEELRKLPVSPPPAGTTQQVQAYKKLYLEYQLKLQEGRNYSNKSSSDRQEMFEIYNELQEKFLAMEPVGRRQVKMVNFPYYRLEEDGKMVFKAKNELTPEQRALNNC